MKNDGRNLLTQSRTQCMRTCLRKHLYSYELGLRPVTQGRALRMGSSIHHAKELVWKGMHPGLAIVEALKPYETIPANCDATAWALEREKVFRLAWAYFQVWVDDKREIVATELPFKLPIVNPETGGRTNSFLAAGKIDAIVRLGDARLVVEETKTTSKDISEQGDYWNRLRIDDQITRYMWAAREMGYKVEAVLYDVIRKPTIEPKLIPLLDENKDKVVIVDATGERAMKANGLPRLSAGEGMTLQQRRETAEEYGERLTEDITTRPEFYFQRREIARLDSEVNEFLHEQWQTQQLLRESQRTGRWFRNTGACLLPYRCEFANLCFNGFGADLSAGVPAGYTQISNVNPELEDEE